MFTYREFASSLEKLMRAEELFFPYNIEFSPYKYYLEHALDHPAKANPYLVEFLVKRYSRPGDLVLDPMAGTGSLCVIASLHGRDAICVDIEPVFYGWMEEARRKVESVQSFGLKGRITNILGDARRLSELINTSVDVVVTSPPYGETNLSATSVERRWERLVKAGYDPKRFIRKHSIFVSKSYGEFSGTPGNIGVLTGKDYYAAMRRVYREMYKVLKPGGVAAVIVKPYIKDRKVVDLPYETFVMLKDSGFMLSEVLKVRLKVTNLWRLKYASEHPEVPFIAHEYVVVVRRELKD